MVNPLTVHLQGHIEDQGDYWVATVDRFPVFGYGHSAKEAMERAMQATSLLCKRHAGSSGQLQAYLGKRGAPYDVATETTRSYCTVLEVPLGTDPGDGNPKALDAND